MELILVLSAAALVLAIAGVILAVTARKIAQEALNRYEKASHTVDLLNTRIDVLGEEMIDTRRLIPEDVVEERQRRNVLMREINNEMERRLEAEKEWNRTVESVLGFNLNVAKGGGEK